MVEGRGAEGRRHSGTHDRGGLADPLLRASSEHFPKCAMREHGGLAWPPRSFRPSQDEAALPTPSEMRKDDQAVRPQDPLSASPPLDKPPRTAVGTP